MSERPTFYREVESRWEIGWKDGDPIPTRKRTKFFGEVFLRHEGKFWKSPDIRTAEDVILLPQSRGFILVNIPPDLEPFRGLPADTFAFANVSTRSRWAQLGIEIMGSANVAIPASLKDEIYSQSNEDLTAFIPVRNLSARPIEIPENTGLFKLYLKSGDMRQKMRLLKLIGNGDIQIGGERGIDWDYWTLDPYGDNRDALDVNLLMGVRLKLDPRKKLWLPPDPEGKPLKIPDTTETHYRDVVDAQLEPAPVSEKPILWVGETSASLKLSPRVNALIHATGQGDRRRDMLHINSLLIDGGSDWKIRTEILSPTVSNRPTEIFLEFLT